MGLLDRAKESIEEAKANAEALAQKRGRSIADLTVEYLGGYEYTAKVQGFLRIYENQIEYVVRAVPAATFTIPIDDVVDLSVEGKEEVSRRVTMTRIFFLGIFAWGAKKKSTDKEAFITLVLLDGREIVFFVKDKSPVEMKRALAGAVSHIRTNAKSVADSQLAAAASALRSDAAPSDDPYESLKKLAELRDMGILTDEEFEAKKAVLLAGI